MKKFAAILTALLLLTAASACAEGEFRTAQAMGPFSEGYAAFQNEQGLYGYIDAQGETVLPFAYEVASRFVNGRAWVKQDGLYRLIDRSGNELSDEYWDNVFSEFNRAAYSRVMRNGLWGYADENGAVALQPVYEKATRFNDGLAAVQKDGTWYLIDEHGVDVLSGADTQA